MSITPPEPLAALEPILDPADTPGNIKGKPVRTWSTGVVAETFFDRTLKWFNNLAWAPPGSSPIIPADIIPEPPAVSGGRSGQRVWTLFDVERLAYHLFHHPRKPDYDATALYRTLDVVYAVARNQGLLPRDVDPIAQLRPAPRAWTPAKRSKAKAKAKTDDQNPKRQPKMKGSSATLEQTTLEDAIDEASQQ